MQFIFAHLDNLFLNLTDVFTSLFFVCLSIAQSHKMYYSDCAVILRMDRQREMVRWVGGRGRGGVT